MLVLVPGLLRSLPQPTLGGGGDRGVPVAGGHLRVRRLWQQRRVEFLLSMTAFLGVALLGVLPGIAVAVALSILNVFRRAWLPYRTTLGRVSGMPGTTTGASIPMPSNCPAW